MNEKELEIKVEELSHSIFSDKTFSEEINFLQKELGVTKKQVIAAWLFWDTAIRKYSNEVYSSKALRFVMHLHNYLPDSWHYKRQEIVLKYLQRIGPKTICEIGFGVPQKYVRHFLPKDIKIFLGDYEQSSLTFARKLLGYWNKDWQEKVDLEIFDLNKDSLPKGYEIYIFQDSIEHANNPTKTLQKYVSSVPKEAIFIFSLPIEIENPIPEHHILWKNEADILDWLKKCDLDVTEHETITMNQDVDIFSLSLHPEFREVVILARKS